MSQLMEGAFNFDQDGIAQVLAAPDWTRFAIRQVLSDLRHMATVAEDDSLSDADVHRIASEVAARIATRDERVADMVLAGIRGKPRRAIVVFLLSLIAALGMIDGAVGGGRLTYDVVKEIVHDVFN